MGNAVGIDASGPLLRSAFVFKERATPEITSKVYFHGSIKVEDKPTTSYVPFDGEDQLRKWFDGVECWRQPWFDTHLYEGEVIRIYYIITCWSKVYSMLSTGLDQLLAKRRNHPEEGYFVRCTGSRRKNLRKIADEIIGMKHLMDPHAGYNILADFIKLKGLQEIKCTTLGFDFFLKGIPGGCFRYKGTDKRITIAGGWPKDLNLESDLFEGSGNSEDLESVTVSNYPYLLVHVKAGCSFHLVTSNGATKRIGGSVIGAGTFLGLASILCPSVKTPFDAFLWACGGDNSRVDIQVSDIYGGTYASVGLEGGLVASSFGKMQPTKLDPRLKESLPSIISNKRALQERQKIMANSPRDPVRQRSNYLQNEEGRSSCLDLLTINDDNLSHEVTEKDIAEEFCSNPSLPPLNIEAYPPLNDNCGIRKRLSLLTPGGQKPLPEGQEPKPIDECDLARSLLTLMTYNITQQAYLNALLYKVPRIVFSGFYLEMPGYLSALQACVTFWDKSGGIGGQNMSEPIDTVFVRMAPFLAAVGAALSTTV
eukprot:GHVH01004735.1.p1 GENE.GHVH01004735.1~~GHVH01004735.1.p1  ORF type:complete len:560 (-),score=69.55 GHVH01004735.1:34-1647(-)